MESWQIFFLCSTIMVHSFVISPNHYVSMASLVLGIFYGWVAVAVYALS